MRKWLPGFAGAFVFFCLFPVSFCNADVDWEVTKAFNFETPPLDIAGSDDGKRIFVLSEGGRLLIYSNDGSLVDTIKVDPAMDRIDVSGERTKPLENTVHLSSRSKKSAQQIIVAFSADIDIAGSPYLGAPDAPVALVVFSDFQ